MKVRFAPSPTGYLHIGNARVALFNYLFALKHKGEFILRIDDTGKEAKVSFEKSIIEDLKWLGLSWDKFFRQSERKEIYDFYFEKLQKKGLVYPCFCTKEELEEEKKKAISSGKPPRYSGKCKKLNPQKIKKLIEIGKPHTWRFSIPPKKRIVFKDLIKGEKSFDTRELGDFIIKRSDGTYTYLFSSVVDDLDMKITHVIRGEDHLSNTPFQILIFEALEHTYPAFAHLPLIKTEEEKPLSKRWTDLYSIRRFREDGFFPEVINTVLFNLGRGEALKKILPLHEMANLFNLSDYKGSGSKFQLDYLKALNRKYILEMDLDALAEKLKDFCSVDVEKEALELIRENATTLSELCFLYRNIILGIYNITLDEEEKEILKDFVSSKKSFEEFVTENKEKKKKIFKTIRKAITGLTYGPPLKDILNFLKEREILRRIEKVLSQ